MFNGMMDPEMIKLAQEQMSKISPSELAKIQQMMSNPEIMKLATESMKDMRPEDLRNAAEQLKHARTEDMVEISEKMAKATPEEISAMRARADAQLTYELNAAEMLKKQGNNLHNQGKFSEAAQKYLLAKNNLKNLPLSKGRMLQLACSLNLMSCYLKTGQYEDCIKEGSEVLAYDAKNVKALYRRGQAYKEMGNLEAAVSDLTEAHEISHDDETIAEVLRDANEKFVKGGGVRPVSKRLVIEEIVEEEVQPTPSLSNNSSSSADYSLGQPEEAEECSESLCESKTKGQTTESPEGLKENSESVRSFHNFVSNANPDALAALSGAGGVPPDMVKSASNMISKMSPEELQKMLEMASSSNGKGPNGLQPSPDMVKTASEMISKMPPEELQKMFEVAASLNGKSPFTTNRANNGQRSGGIPTASDLGESSSSGMFSNLNASPVPTSNLPTSSADLQEQMRNQMKDPAMKQMFSSMIKNMSPDMMANMSEQFGVKMSKDEAAKAQQAMSSLSPEDLDRMMRWADRVQKAAEGARKTKNWLLGRPGMILAICMLILAIILHRLGYIGG